MHRLILTLACSMLLVIAAAVASADLDGWVADLNLRAKADLDAFHARLSAQFDLPLPEVKVLVGTVDAPADAFLCLQLGQWTHKPLEVVTAAYQAGKGKGWGVLAQELGVKPGSEEFHALKEGRLSLTGEPPAKAGKAKGQGKGKAKGKKK